MFRIKALKIEQSGFPMYVTALSVGQIKALFKSNQLIVDIYDPRNPPGKEGYQRGIDENRVNDISAFLSKTLDILPSLLPGSIILNCRPRMPLRFDSSTNELVINDDVVFHVVDGQHRVKGLEKSRVQKYEVPVTIIQGLNIAQEAGQFLTINTKQKRVRPDLQLRILYHQDTKNTRRLIDTLGLENWKIEALTIAIALNDRNESPWRNLILRPGEKKDDQWKPITEANFVDSLKNFCSSESSVKALRLEEKEKFLIGFWNEIRKLYEPAFSEESGSSYSLTRGIGAGILNTLAPALYSLNLSLDTDVDELLRPLKSKYPIEDWRRKTGRISKRGSSQSAYKSVSEEILRKIYPALNYRDDRAYDRLLRKAEARAHEKTLEKAYSLLSPLALRPSQDLKQDWTLKGCYVLVRSKSDSLRVYVGKSQNAKRRLKQHNVYDLYAMKSCSSDWEMEAMEMALYHLVKPSLRENENHPSPADRCPFCGR